MTKALYRKTLVFVTMTVLIWSLQACQHHGQDTLIQKNPEKALKLRTQLAAEYLYQGDIDAAKRALDVVLAKQPKDVDANMMMGVLLQQEASPNNLKLAEGYFKRAIAEDPKHAQARNNYATYLYQQQRFPEAIAQLKVAGSTLGYDQRYRALENLGQIYLSLGDVALAEKSFQQALQANRDSRVSMLKLAEIYYEQHDFTAARPYYEHYVQLIGQNNQGADALWLGTRLARTTGDNEGMQKQLNQLRALFPESQQYQRYLQLQYSTEAVWK